MVEGTAAKLLQTFPDDDVGWMVTCQPVLLVEDIDYILQELGRWLLKSPHPNDLFLVVHFQRKDSNGSKQLMYLFRGSAKQW